MVVHLASVVDMKLAPCGNIFAIFWIHFHTTSSNNIKCLVVSFSLGKIKGSFVWVF